MAELLQKKIFSRAIISDNGCLEWQGAKSKAGYGQVWFDGKVTYTHRAIAEIYHGKPQLGQEVLHLCDNRACCAPNHLIWGTRKENMDDASSKGRLFGKNHVMGEAHPSSKMTSEQVAKAIVMRLQGKKLKDLAQEFNVSIAAIHQIVKGNTRKNG